MFLQLNTFHHSNWRCLSAQAPELFGTGAPDSSLSLMSLTKVLFMTLGSFSRTKIINTKFNSLKFPTIFMTFKTF